MKTLEDRLLFERTAWDAIGREAQPSWYLDPLVAEQKKQVHRKLALRWSAGLNLARVVKTDLFEEAFGDDDFYTGLFGAALHVGLEFASTTARAAARRGLEICISDVRQIGLASNSVDLVLSNSTLDHFAHRREFLHSLAELHRVLRPGGVLILTLDNPHNLLYPLLRLWTHTRWAPFPLGYTASREETRRDLENLGFAVTSQEWLIHNPRLLSTGLFLALRKLLGARAGRAIALALRAFANLGRWPTRRYTACFHALRAVKT